jgi:hypothetical protein
LGGFIIGIRTRLFLKTCGDSAAPEKAGMFKK